MLHLVKRSLLVSGLIAFAAYAPAASAQPGGSSPWLPQLPSGAGPTTVAPAAAGPIAQAGPAGAALAAAPGAATEAPSGPYEDSPALAATAPAGAPADPQRTPEQLYEHVQRGVVALERNGVPLAIGTVLSGDGRVLTALSGLGGNDAADVRYADGTLVHAKVGRSDRASDLALLVPATLKWTEGLNASDADPAGQDLRAMLPSLPGRPGNLKTHLGPAVAAVKGQVDAHGRDGQPLARMLDLDLKGSPVAGAPVLDSTGSVVAVLVRACKGAADPMPAPTPDTSATWYPTPAAPPPPPPACKPMVVGAPVAAIRSFLAKAAPAPAPAPWLGIRGETVTTGNVRGVRVTAVAPSSPAEKASLKPSSDVIVAVDGQPIDTPEKLADLIGKHAPGDGVKLLVYGGDQFREVVVTLRAAP